MPNPYVTDELKKLRLKAVDTLNHIHNADQSWGEFLVDDLVALIVAVVKSEAE